MSQKDQLINLIMEDNVKELISAVKNERNIDSANYTISIHESKTSSNQGRNDGQTILIPEDGLTLLHVAAFYDALECFRFLELSRGIPLDKKSSHSFLPIHYACWSGASEVSLYILTKRPELSSYSVEGGGDIQLLYCSLMGGDAEIIQNLFDKGASLTHAHNNQNNLIAKAIGLHRGDILRIIFKYYVPRKGSADTPPVVKAVIDHNPEALEMLYSGKDDILNKMSDKQSENLISLICENDRDKKFKTILTQKILIDAKSLELEPNNPNLPGIAHWACSYMDVDVAKQMFKLPGCKINRLESNKTCASRIANKKNDNNVVVDMLNCLIDNGFEINNTHGGKTPTLLESFLTAIQKNYDAIKFLISRGAEVDVPFSKNRNQTLYQYVMAMKGFNDSVKKLFQEAHDKK